MVFGVGLLARYRCSSSSTSCAWPSGSSCSVHRSPLRTTGSEFTAKYCIHSRALLLAPGIGWGWGWDWGWYSDRAASCRLQEWGRQNGCTGYTWTDGSYGMCWSTWAHVISYLLLYTCQGTIPPSEEDRDVASLVEVTVFIKVDKHIHCFKTNLLGEYLVNSMKKPCGSHKSAKEMERDRGILHGGI